LLPGPYMAANPIALRHLTSIILLSIAYIMERGMQQPSACTSHQATAVPMTLTPSKSYEKRNMTVTVIRVQGESET
jgi:hypothetical protein